MRAFVTVLWICCWAVPVLGSPAKTRSPALQFGGQEYVNLQEWAEATQFAFSRKEEEVKLVNHESKLFFKVNSQRVEVNGINLFLAFPVALLQGAVCVAQRDIDRTLRPILFPARNRTNQVIRTVALSAGHGGKDSGYQLGKEQEKKYTLLLTTELERLLNRAGLKTVLIRSTDKFVERDDRPRIAKRRKADLYLEMHYNCAGPGNTETRGVEVYCLTPTGAISTNGGSDHYPGLLPGNQHDERNILLAYQIHSALVEKVALTDRGVRRARFEVLREADMPAVLIEAGFMSQPDEMRKIQDGTYRRQTAQAIVDGLLAYKRLVER